ncbi:MAG: RES family NAD+ phosphorylase [Acidimicrobiia bacterium]
MIPETLVENHEWLRICEAAWTDPLDPTFAQAHGGRWNPPGSWPTLYLTEDVVTARLNLTSFIAGWPYRPEELNGENAPHLAVATLPRSQTVADVHTSRGVSAAGLPTTYPFDVSTDLIPHAVCQPIGADLRKAGMRGVRCRSAQTPLGAGRELAWFPATSRSRAHLVERRQYADWFWG